MRNFWLVFVVISTVSFGQIDEGRRITKSLCSPEFHGRGYVEKGDSLAAAFLAAEFEKIGVGPVKKSYFQRFQLPVNTFPGEMRVYSETKEFTPGIHFMVDPASSACHQKLVPKLITTEVALNKEGLIKELESILTSNEYNSIVLDFTSAGGDTLKMLSGLGRELTELFPVIEIVNSKFTWSVSQSVHKNAHMYIQDSVYTGESVRVEIDAKHIPNYESQNVIAYLPSKKKKAKTVVFTAHYDHLGRMGMNTYFPGANDNASGTAMLITLAKHFKANPSEFNVLFIAFGGEEAGLLGSQFFVENPCIKLDKIEFLLNLDIMGSGEDGVTVVNATLFEEEFQLLETLNRDHNYLTQIKRRGPAANSDHYWFTEKGVPAFFIYTMGLNRHYHDVFDRYEELSFSEYSDITRLLIDFVEALEKR